MKEAGVAYNAGKFPFVANGRAKANRTTLGFVKMQTKSNLSRFKQLVESRGAETGAWRGTIPRK